MSPVAIARQPHDLPGVPIDRDRGRAGDAAARIAADGLGRGVGAGVVLRPNSSLAASAGSCGFASGGRGFGATDPLSCAKTGAASINRQTKTQDRIGLIRPSYRASGRTGTCSR